MNNEIMSMNNWLELTNKFLTLSDQKILESTGSVSHELAITTANQEYDKFKVKQDREYISDFDEVLDKYLKGEDNL